MRGCYDENVQTEAARIKVENMHADFLMQCPGFDDCSPSDEVVPGMVRILKETGYPYRVQATVYEKRNHLLCDDLSTSPEYLKSMKKILQAEYADQDAQSLETIPAKTAAYNANKAAAAIRFRSCEPAGI